MAKVGIFLFGHQKGYKELDAYGCQLHYLQEKNAPFTFFFTGSTLDEADRKHPLVREKIRSMFGSGTQNNPYVPEIGISSYNNTPIVPFSLERGDWEMYFSDFVCPEIGQSKAVLKERYGKDASGFFPPGCMYAAAVNGNIECSGIDYVVVSGKKLGSTGKGKVYRQGDTKLLPRDNEIRMWGRVTDTVDDIKRRSLTGHDVIVIGERFDYDRNGNHGLSLSEGTAFLCKLADELYRAEGLEFMNLSGIAARGVQGTYPPGKYDASTWLSPDGDVSPIGNYQWNGLASSFLKSYIGARKAVEGLSSSGRVTNGIRKKLDDMKGKWLSNVGDIQNSVPGKLKGLEYSRSLDECQHDMAIVNREIAELSYGAFEL